MFLKPDYNLQFDVSSFPEAMINKEFFVQGDEPDEILLSSNNLHTLDNDDYHSNELPSDRNRSQRSPSISPLAETLHDKELDAIFGEDKVSYDSSSESPDNDNGEQFKSRTTNSNIANGDEKTNDEYSYISKANKELPNTKTKEAEGKRWLLERELNVLL